MMLYLPKWETTLILILYNIYLGNNFILLYFVGDKSGTDPKLDTIEEEKSGSQTESA